MKGLLISLTLLPITAIADLEWLATEPPQAVFGDGNRALKINIHNTATSAVEKAISVRLYQSASETMAPIGKTTAWKKLTVLAGQTVMEHITLTLPKVEAETSFRLFWMDDTGKTLAHTDFTVHPTRLLQDLVHAGGQRPLAVFDPGDRLKPLLRAQEMDFEELTVGGHPEAFRGRLAIILPENEPGQEMDFFASRLGRTARERGMALVWFQTPDKRRTGEPPMAYTVHDGRATIVKAPSALLANLEHSPEAQLSLVWLANYAVQHNRMTLPAASEP